MAPGTRGGLHLAPAAPRGLGASHLLRARRNVAFPVPRGLGQGFTARLRVSRVSLTSPSTRIQQAPSHDRPVTPMSSFGRDSSPCVPAADHRTTRPRRALHETHTTPACPCPSLRETQTTPACPCPALRETHTTPTSRKTPISGYSREAGAARVSLARPTPQAGAARVSLARPSPQTRAAAVARRSTFSPQQPS